MVNRPRLLLLDGHSLAYRAFFALPAENFRTGTGQTTNAVYGFTSMLINVLRDEAIIELAREDAQALLADDPELSGHPQLRARVDDWADEEQAAYLEKG